MIEFRDYRTDERQRVIALLAQGRGADYAALKSAVFDWQFFSNPELGSASPFIVGTVGEDIVALNGFMPVKLRYRGANHRGCWSCDTFVSSEYRGQGFGKLLIQRVSERFPVMLGYGISDMSDPIFEKFGWTRDASLNTMFLHVAESGLKGFAKNSYSRWKRMGARPASSAETVVGELDGDYGQDVDDLWARSAPSYWSTVQRDSSYLNWKYRRHPLHQYTCLTVHRAHLLCGLMIVRHDADTSVIADYSGGSEDQEAMRALLSASIDLLASKGTIRVQCETALPALKAVLASAGFRSTTFSSRFRVLHPGDLPEQRTARWFTMPGDSDGEVITRSTRLVR